MPIAAAKDDPAMSNLDFAGQLLVLLSVVAVSLGALAVLGYVLYSAARVIAYGWHRGKTEALEKFYVDKCPIENPADDGSDDVEQEITDA